MKKLLIAAAALAALFGMQAASAQTAGAQPYVHSHTASTGAKGHHYHRGWSHSRHHRHDVLRHKARRHHHRHHP